jgi:2'-5' RNA ligase
MSTLSLWLEPSPDIAAGFRGSIKQLSAQFDTPSFAPHVTIIGGFQADEDRASQWTAELATSFQPVTVTFDSYGFEDVIVRAAYLKGIINPELARIRTAAGKLFSFPDHEYLPHMSLLYSDTTPETTRRAAVSELDLALPLSVRFEAITLWRTEFDPANPDFTNWIKLVEAPLSTVH